MARVRMLNKKTRFEIFKRDGFKCQYCGRTPPAVMLELDHIIPIAQGGTNDFPNLLTSCFDCNRGKGNTPLGFTKVRGDLAKETKKLAEREKQLKDYQKLKSQIHRRENRQLNTIDEMISGAYNDKICLSEHGRDSFRRFLQIFTVDKILEALDVAINRKRLGNGEDAIKYTYGILHNWRRELEGNAK